MLPGPTTLSTFSTLAVPRASAATACAPPSFTMWLTPASFAAASITSGTPPPRSGGVAITMRLTPAMRAGIAFMNTLLG